MHIGIDIDGTIAGRNMGAFVAACNRQFGLGIAPEEHLTYKELLAHPVMQAHQHASAAHFAAELSRLEQAPPMLRVLPTLPGAAEGVQKLAQHGDLAYYTVRKAFPPYSLKVVEQSTNTWLRDHAFPNPDRVVFCMSLMNKLLQVYQRLRARPETFVLIDDLAPELSQAWIQLQAGHHPHLRGQACQQVCELLRQHLVLVAFGASSPVAINSDFQVASLPSWEEVGELIPLFQL